MEDVTLDISQIDENLSISRGEKPDVIFDLKQIGEAFVTDQFGIKHKFKTLYQQKKTLIIFIRNFLCFIGKEYCDDLSLIPEKYFKEANVNLVVIGCGPHKFIKPFRKATGYRGPLLVDADLILHKSLGLYSKDKVFNGEESTRPPPSCHVKSNFVSGVIQATWRGLQYREFQGDLSQQGGSFIMGPGNVLHFHHFDTAAYDHVPINDLLAMVGVQQVNFPRDTRVLTL